MINNTPTKMSLKETQQIVESVFPFIQQIPEVPLIYLDEIKDNAPSVCFLTEEGRQLEFNVVGGYKGEFNFTILYKVKNDSTKERLEATRLLNYLGQYLEDATRSKGLPHLNNKDIPISLLMTTAPTLLAREDNGTVVYSAGYTLVYRHKSQYE